jgi:hypothetical protein
MKTGLRIYVTRSASFSSRFIRFFLRSSFASHIAGGFLAIANMLRLVLESSEKGTRFDIEDRFVKKNMVEAEFELIGGQLSDGGKLYEEIAEFTRSALGKEYDYLSGGAIGIKRRLRFLWKIPCLRRWLEKKFGPQKTHCSELWTRFLRPHGYIASLGNKEPDLVGPVMLAGALLKDPNFRTVFISDGFRRELGVLT